MLKCQTGRIEFVFMGCCNTNYVIGDMAYVSEENLETCGEEITLIARTNTAVAAAAQAELDERFSFNKDAKMLQCPAGELAMRVDKRNAKNGNQYHSYIFSTKNVKNVRCGNNVK